MENRSHYNWRFELEWNAQHGDCVAQSILSEGQTPGKYFDGITHFFDVIHTLRQLKRDPGVQAIGIFGSRLLRKHESLRSDMDIFVINDTPIEYDWSPNRGPTTSREIYRHVGTGGGVNIQECSTENWNNVVCNPSSVRVQAYEIMKSVRWLWIIKNYSIETVS